MKIIRDAITEARWRDDLDCYNECSRHTRFSFLSQFDDSPYWKSEEVVSIDDKPFVANYQPIDVITSVIKNWGNIYDHPYLYTMVTHLLEASCDLTAPPNFEEKIKYFIYRAGRLYDEAQGVTQDDSFNESAYAWIGNLTAAHDSAREGKGSVQRPVEGR
ncbi:hypothetical protein [Butyrivibrio sp. JL13D10]|uniref:hypothetical protein n=1 Tax=Butyrivibrio sp. JL13D10 TaxID=3236815 RepID=UPI0038B58CBC